MVDEKDYLPDEYKKSMIVDFKYIEELVKKSKDDLDFDVVKPIFESFVQKNAIIVDRLMNLMINIEKTAQELKNQVSITNQGTGFFYGTPIGSQITALIELSKDYQKSSRIEVSNILNLLTSFLEAKKTSKRPTVKKEEKATKMIDILHQRFQEGE